MLGIIERNRSKTEDEIGKGRFTNHLARVSCFSFFPLLLLCFNSRCDSKIEQTDKSVMLSVYVDTLIDLLSMKNRFINIIISFTIILIKIL
jgi:hypothetical protein